MPFNIGDARDLTNYKSTCMLMDETVKKYGKQEYYSYKQVLGEHADEIIQDNRDQSRQKLEEFIKASLGK